MSTKILITTLIKITTKGMTDDDGEQELIDDDDDFDIPPIRVKKQTKSDKSTSKKKTVAKGKSGAKEALRDLG